jgi:hypothetical protein
MWNRILDVAGQIALVNRYLSLAKLVSCQVSEYPVGMRHGAAS